MENRQTDGDKEATRRTERWETHRWTDRKTDTGTDRAAMTDGQTATRQTEKKKNRQEARLLQPELRASRL